MTRDEFDRMGNLHKQFEAQHTSTKLTPGLPVVARLDGRSFKGFTFGMERPYDAKLALCLQETAGYLLRETNANIAYRQSDEITLVWSNQDLEKEMLFGGKTHKLLSVLAAMATAKFNQMVAQHLPAHAHKLPVFDCRVYQYPTLELAADTLVWRQADAIRNSLSMLAQAHFSHNELHGKSTTDMYGMLEAQGVFWWNMPTVFQRGILLRKEKMMKTLTAQELAALPERQRPVGPVPRTVVQLLASPPLKEIANLVDVVFSGSQPTLISAGGVSETS